MSTRPAALNPLFAPVTALGGIGTKTARLVEEFMGGAVLDMLWHLPTGIIDRRYRPALVEVEEGRVSTFEVEVMKHEDPKRRGLPYRILCSTEGGFLTLVFFRAKADWLTRAMPVGSTRLVSGQVQNFRDRLQIVHPDYMLPQAEFEKLPVVEPTYPLTAGLSARVLTKALIDALSRLPKDLPEWHTSTLVQKQGWGDWHGAMMQAHRPSDSGELDANHPARRRLAYDELLAHQLALQIARRERRRQGGRAFDGENALKSALFGLLPFTLTQAQLSALREIEDDMQEPRRMLRLLQGDVGSGKTLVALSAMLRAVEGKAQAAIMAPTEILAYQHAQNLGPYLDTLGVKWQLFSGRNTAKQRALALQALADGTVDIAIGTHALFQSDVVFANLGMVVVDEQHRFGVQQRMELSSKGGGVDILVMTATPIPRTLALTAYGDMDISVIGEKPAGRQSIETRVINIARYGDVASRLQALLDSGQRAYWVCPLVRESAESDLAAAEDRYQELQKRYGDAVGLIHGQMKTPEKDRVMARFQAGEIGILVATTVVEVGVDVPEATVMIVEHAERFGLAQLHQLRGRVGRGTAQSSCLLLYRPPLGRVAQARLATMQNTDDGFKIADEDLRLRGAGEVLGTRQSGMPYFRLVDLDAHADLMEMAQQDVELLMESDAYLTSPRGQALRFLLYMFRRDEVIGYLHAA